LPTGGGAGPSPEVPGQEEDTGTNPEQHQATPPGGDLTNPLDGDSNSEDGDHKLKPKFTVLETVATVAGTVLGAAAIGAVGGAAVKAISHRASGYQSVPDHFDDFGFDDNAKPVYEESELFGIEDDPAEPDLRTNLVDEYNYGPQTREPIMRHRQGFGVSLGVGLPMLAIPLPLGGDSDGQTRMPSPSSISTEEHNVTLLRSGVQTPEEHNVTVPGNIEFIHVTQIVDTSESTTVLETLVPPVFDPTLAPQPTEELPVSSDDVPLLEPVPPPTGVVPIRVTTLGRFYHLPMTRAEFLARFPVPTDDELKEMRRYNIG